MFRFERPNSGTNLADIAQLVEQQFCKLWVLGSSPSVGSITQSGIAFRFCATRSYAAPPATRYAARRSAAMPRATFPFPGPNHYSDPGVPRPETLSLP